MSSLKQNAAQILGITTAVIRPARAQVEECLSVKEGLEQFLMSLEL